MEDAIYHSLLDNLLENIVESIEIQDEENVIDAEYQDGMLNIELADGGEFVINKHGPTQQLWMSSPYSGAHHYAYDDMEGTWLNTKDGNDFLETFIEDIAILTRLKLHI
jgi:frataxin